MYAKALQLEPQAHVLLTLDKVESLLPITASSTRVGRGPNSAVFAAFPSLAADTLAFIPYPLAQFAALPGNATLTHNAALDRDSDMLLAFATDWSKQFPQSPDAQEALADVLEVRGEVSDSSGRPSALGAVLSALATANDQTQRLRLIGQEVRLRYKRSEFVRAQELADSVLQNHKVVTSEEAGELIPLAAMTGRVNETARLARAGGWALTSTSVAIAAPLTEIESISALGARGVQRTDSCTGASPRKRASKLRARQ